MERPQPPLTEVGEMGEGLVQVRGSPLVAATVQRAPQSVCSLEIGSTMIIFTATKNMKSRAKRTKRGGLATAGSRVSRTVLWERRGELKRMSNDENIQTRIDSPA